MIIFLTFFLFLYAEFYMNHRNEEDRFASPACLAVCPSKSNQLAATPLAPQ